MLTEVEVCQRLFVSLKNKGYLEGAMAFDGRILWCLEL